MKASKMKQFWKHPIFWILGGAFVLALLVIFVGPYLFESFEQLTLRLLVGFSIFFGTVLMVLVYILYFREQTQKRLQERKALRAKSRELTDEVEKKIKDLKSRFVEATKIINNSSIYKNKHADYELPWYLMVGSEGEGKTALLESSGLEFPLNINYANRSAKDEGTTQSFQWYFAEHAIFVDMPGRYIEQHEDSADADLWAAFLRLFRRQRWKRPINGVVLTISVDTLIEKSERELEHFAKELRDRFDELSETFMATIPIYLFVTKSDKVSGFDQYFASISDEEKNEVLGMTFDDSANVDSAKVQPELDALIQRLNASVLDRMQQEWDNDARTKILLFCDEFAALFEKLKLFIDIGFAQTRYRAPLLLRGIYFTSVPQQTLPDFASENGGSLPAAAEAKGLFIRRVLRDIMFPEADIIKMDTTYRQKQKNRQLGIFVAAAALVLFVTLLWVGDFSEHADRVDTIEDMMTQYGQDLSKLREGEDFEKSLYVLNELRDTVAFDDDNSSVSFWKLVFYKTEARQEKLHALYHTALERLLLPYVGALLQAQVQSNLEDYDLTWESTKAYLMLNDEANRNPQFLQRWLATAWSHLYPNKLPVQNALNDHWNVLLGEGFTPLALNQATVESARQKLLGLGQEALVYKQLRDRVAARGLKGFQFAGVMGSNAATFAGNDYAIPGFYTKQGYETIMVPEGKELIREIIQTNWIVGYDTNLTDAELNDMYAKVQSFYFNDYKKEWMNALNALQLPKETTISQISNQLTVLTAADTPIVSILRALKENTELYTPSEKLQMAATQEGSKLASMGQSATGKVAKKAANSLGDTSVKNLREFFGDYHNLLTREGGQAPILQASIEQMEKAYLETTAMNGSVSPRKDAFRVVIDRINGKHLPIAIRATSLPIPVNKWFETALRNDWEYIISQSKSYVDDQYKSQVYAYYKEKLEGRYPLSPGATRDISLLDFEEYFKKGGVLDQFYVQYVAPFVSLNQNRRAYEYRSIDGSTMYFDRRFVRSMFVANDIRKRFVMNKGESASTTFYLKPSHLGRNLAGMALHYDNNYYGYEHGPVKSRKVSWPAETENPAARFQLFDLNNNKVVSFSDDGEWALFRLMGRLTPKRYRESSTESVVLEYNKGDYRAAFTVSGPPAKMFSKDNPFRYYRLSGGI